MATTDPVDELAELRENAQRLRGVIARHARAVDRAIEGIGEVAETRGENKRLRVATDLILELSDILAGRK